MSCSAKGAAATLRLLDAASVIQLRAPYKTLSHLYTFCQRRTVGQSGAQSTSMAKPQDRDTWPNTTCHSNESCEGQNAERTQLKRRKHISLRYDIRDAPYREVPSGLRWAPARLRRASKTLLTRSQGNTPYRTHETLGSS